MKRICLIYNFAQHYRAPIFHLLDSELEIDFYFGDKMLDVKKLDYSLLLNFKKELKNQIIKYPFYWQKGAVRLLFNKKYDKYIILGEYYCFSTWLILLLGKLFTNKKIYLWSHGWYGNETYLKKLVKKYFFNLSTGIFLYGDYAKKIMKTQGFSDKKLHVIYNSLDYENQFKIRQGLGRSNVYQAYFANANPVLLYCGRLTKVKGLELLINASIILKKKNIPVNIVFIGKGEEEQKLKKLLTNIEIKNWFVGECYDEVKLGEFIFNASICISPGNVGLTAMHSLVYGTPVITHGEKFSQMPEFEAIEPDITGDFFMIGDEIDLAYKIEKWLHRTQKNREEIRKNCYKIIDQKYNPNYQMRVIKNVLETG